MTDRMLIGQLSIQNMWKGLRKTATGKARLTMFTGMGTILVMGIG